MHHLIIYTIRVPHTAIDFCAIECLCYSLS